MPSYVDPEKSISLCPWPPLSNQLAFFFSFRFVLTKTPIYGTETKQQKESQQRGDQLIF